MAIAEEAVVADAVEARGQDVQEKFVPSANGVRRDAAICIYTNTPDRHFLIDCLGEGRRVVVVSPCSGHGFKSASAVGEAAACLAAGTPPRVDLSPFALSRRLRGMA